MGRVNTEQSDSEQPGSNPATGEGSSSEPEARPAASGDGGTAASEPDPGSDGDGSTAVGAAGGRASRKLLALLFGVAALLLAADVVTKIAAVARLDGQPPLELFGGAVYLVLVRNPGAAFSLATGMTWLLALLAIVVVGVIVWLAPKLRSTGWAVGLGLVLGGACGNLVDRLFREPGPLRGHVVDFVSLFAPDGSVWPVFNVADSSIVCGGILVVLLSLLGRDYDGTVHTRKKREDRA
ncbi:MULTISPECIES: signal peptidase II [Saccharopolyspora]|uniref:Lipoprotein signal peptidase n=1 Tax=Saccharopolyspora gregorii TaxID=33914 RepID=A0ABP6RKY0_9PSEU|nr:MULTISPECIES: signal peptidase II [Saccharopolyspora]MCA1187329.1 signal peptidase II [Saccharopolyspora sp. 6T]MCA1193617.1 signal peptidase II [Saccharopolyspora sp. 6V]MCA1227731.1 signal peptidase II [Saccharopolyspora sp. 6M]MCA1280303.1 signal peptidase II [Saccharopolyspora sp. 7B]